MTTVEPTDRPRVAEALVRAERTMDPGAPERGGDIRVLGYGEISVALAVAELPGLVCKRMSGFADDGSAAAYVVLVGDYLTELRETGVTVAPTDVVTVPRPGRPPVVYLVQPRLATESLGDHILRTGDDETLAAAVSQTLAVIARLAGRSADRGDGSEVALDGQLSNWSFNPEPAAEDPVLIDVGTPFMRTSGRHAMDREVLLAPVPPGIRAYYRRRRLVEAYLDDYFVPRTVALDLLGNFHKEGAAGRMPVGLEVVNTWLGEADVPGPRGPVTAEEVGEYYRKDADLLALYLRLRRVDRFVRTRLLRGTYDYVLPGPVRR